MPLHLLYFIIFFTLSCTTIPERNTIPSGVFNASFSIVWQSALLALEKYPLKNLDRESGEMETEIIRGYQVWQPPPGSIPTTRNRHYVIKLLFIKGSFKEKTATKVQILKEEFINKDFIQESVPIQSNGIEEEIILYRINRIIKLVQLKKDFFEQQKNKKDEI